MTFQEQFILDFQQHVKNKVPEFRYVDENLGQWGDDNFRSAVSFPAILIDFPNTTYQDIGNEGQMGFPTIELTLLFAINSQSYNLASLEVREKALLYYRLEQKLVASLKLFEGDYFTPLVRTSAQSKNKNDLGLRVRELTFTSSFEEYFDELATADYTLDFQGELG
jgi:hypothetical protein